jgi:2-polyprenyl-3-methyl-5-hydroxy-6-metoxy-1,4-benzoquinol methylase
VQIGTTADLDPRSRFDTILYIDVLEHIEDDRAEMARAAERLAEP